MIEHKECKHCHQEKPITVFREWRTKTGKEAISGICNPCEVLNGKKASSSYWKPNADNKKRGYVPSKKNEKEGFIYFIYAPEVNRVKIGFCSKNLRKRLSSLQGQSACSLVLIGYRHGKMKHEHELHMRFSEHKAHYEWFTYADEIRDFVLTLQVNGVISADNKVVKDANFERWEAA